MTQMTLEQAMQIAVGHHNAGRLAEAEALYRQILAAAADHPDANHMLGVLAFQVGHAQPGMEFVRKAISLRPTSPDYFASMGMIQVGIGDFEGAVQSCKRSLDIRVSNPNAHNNMGNALLSLGRFDEAVESFRQAVKYQPNVAGFQSNLANALVKAGQADEAITICGRAIQMDPRCTEAFNNLGMALKEKGQVEESIDAFNRAIELNPQMAEAHSNLADAFRSLGRIDDAIAAFARAAQLNPNEPLIHWNYSLALLAAGQFARGWDEFEWRTQCPGLGLRRNFTAPQWNGEDLHGKTLLLHAEGGFGDALQFSRYVPMLAGRGGRLILECQPTLASLFSELPGIEAVIPRGVPLPAFDIHIPLQSLPRIFKTDLTNIPCDVPYLKASAEKIDHWRARVRGDGLKVGLVWSGVSHAEYHPAEGRRIGSLECLSPLARIHGARFFSLQKGPGAALPKPPEMEISDVAADIKDFTDTAAIISLLDLVIGVDTSVVHLAGALARPVWVIVPFVADFRWLIDRTDSPWYPTMQLFRQRTPDDSAEVMNQVAAALGEKCR